MRPTEDNRKRNFSSYHSGIKQTLKSFLMSQELILLLVNRDIQSRYRRSFLGLIWTLLNPILFSLVLWVVFVSVFKANLSNGTQYGPYLLAGVLVITFFNQGVIQSAEAISNSGGLFLKIRIDPALLVFSNVISNLVNFLIGIVALIIVTNLSGATFSIKAPLVLILGLLLSVLIAGIGLILGNLFVRFDDLKYIVTVVLQILTYMTPVFYPKEMLHETVRFIVNLNPLTSFLDVFRNIFNGTEVATLYDWLYVLGSPIITFILGLYFFRRTWAKTVVMM